MAILENIKPERVMYWFEKLCSIPHGSGNTTQATSLCRSFAQANELEFYEDELGNCIIKKPASDGYENSPAVILQGHIDMVCEKEKHSEINFENDGLDICVLGDYITANGTTLGADDGIGVAMTLAVLEDKTAKHPAIEALFTVDEEIGMIGAAALDASGLKGKYMINLDHGDEKAFTVSCVGGVVAECTIPVSRESYNGKAFKFEVFGLTGGHSGVEIDKYRANADILLGRILDSIDEDYRIVSVNGGLKDNAIPTSAELIVVSTSDISDVADSCLKIFEREFAAAEKSLKLICTQVENEIIPMDKASTERIKSALLCYPNGIQNMTLEIPGLPKTSLNLGILETKDNCVCASFCVRSSLNSEKHALVRRIEALTKLLGGTVKTEGDYPPWEYLENSYLRNKMTEVYKQVFNREPILEATHGGLECGMIISKIPGLECISIGPDMSAIHTPEERLSISSTERVWNYLLAVLESFK